MRKGFQNSIEILQKIEQEVQKKYNWVSVVVINMVCELRTCVIKILLHSYWCLHQCPDTNLILTCVMVLMVLKIVIKVDICWNYFM